MKPVPDGGLPSTRGDPWQPHTCPHRLVSLAFGGWLLWGGMTRSRAVTKNKSCGTCFYALLATYPRIGLSLLNKASPPTPASRRDPGGAQRGFVPWCFLGEGQGHQGRREDGLMCAQ